MGSNYLDLRDSSDATYISRQGLIAESWYSAGSAITLLPTWAGTIVSVKSTIRGKSDVASALYLQGGPIITGTYYNYHGDTVTDAWASFTSATYTLNNKTGVTWSTADIASLGWYAGCYGYSVDGQVGYVSEFSFEVAWEYVSGGFVSFVLQLLGYIPTMFAFKDMARLVVEVYRRSKVIIGAREYAALYREIREGRCARHFLIGMR